MTYSSLRVTCPRCGEEVTYDEYREEWIGDNDTRCSPGGGDVPGGHKVSVDGSLVYILTMDGINGLLRRLALGLGRR